MATKKYQKTYYARHREEINKRRREQRKENRIAQIRIEMQAESDSKKPEREKV